MACSNVFALMCAFVLITLATAEQSVRCSDVEDVTWATDGKTCRVFRNPCEFIVENRNRQHRSEEALQIVTKEKCQELCQTVCPQIYSPICAIYNGTKRTFTNECWLNVYVCQSGETYRRFALRPCESEDVAE